MARKRRQEMSFGTGSFLDVLCNMVGILIILVAVVGMRVADKDEPVVDLPEVEAPPEVVVVDPRIEERRLLNERRRQENEARMAAHQQALAEYEAERLRKETEWQRLLEEMEARNAQLADEIERTSKRVQIAAAEFDVEENRRKKLVEMVTAALSQNAELRLNETELQKQAIELMQRRKQLQDEIAAQKLSQAIRKPVYEVVAHDGNSGTNRRPILIECRADGLVFASEQVTVSARTLNDYGPDDNPLLAGASALANYWKLVDAQNGRPESRPYILLIVRPEGTVGFYVARRYLEALQQDYGYELVPSDMDIKWPPADPEAVQVCRTAVERAINNPKALAKRMPNGVGRGSGAGGASGSSRTGFGRPGNDQIVGANGEFTLPEIDELRRANPKDSIGMLGPEWSPQRQRLTNSRPGPAGQPTGPETYTTGMGEGGGPATSEGDSRIAQGSRSRAFPGMEAAAADGGRSTRGAESFAGNASANGATSSGFNGVPSGNEGNPLGVAGGGVNIVPPAPEEPGKRRHPLEPSPGMSGDENRSDASSGLAGSSSSRATPGLIPPDMPSSPLAERGRGLPNDGGKDRHWGKGYRSGAIGIEREIVFQLYPDKLVIVDGPSVTLPQGISREEFHQIVAAMIQVQANSWGDPPQKFVWRPRLKIEIYPGGNQHYGRLKELLNHWGLSSKVEHILK